jgi:ribosomal protein L24
MARFSKGTKVEWTWGKGHGEGKITETFTEDVERTIKGVEIKRKATKEEPAYLIEQANGDHVLKSRSELRPAS